MSDTEKRQIRLNQRTLDAIAQAHPELADETYNTQILALNEKAKLADLLTGLLVFERMPVNKKSDSLERTPAAVNARNKSKLRGLYGSLGHDIEWLK